MQPGYESFKKQHGFLRALNEMKALEGPIIEETTEASKRTDNPHAKRVFGKWAQDSKEHSRLLQDIIDGYRGAAYGAICKTCMSDLCDASYNKFVLGKLLEVSKGRFAARDLYDLTKKHLFIEGDLARNYAEMAEMTDDEDMKAELIRLEGDEKVHHEEAQQLIDALEKTYGRLLKEV
jgi:rubrerythrin